VNEQDKFEQVASTAGRILDAYGRHETSDSSRVMYTAGDLNVAREAGVIEIIYRGTLVFRYDLEGGAADRVFEEHGVWVAQLTSIAGAITEPPEGTPPH
jgi:hypothetical protein